MLAASVDLKIELEAFTFVDGSQTGTLYRADMHERIRLAVIAHQKAEALHGIEEFDRASDPFACQFALRRSRSAGFDGDHIPDNLKILRGDFPAAIHQIEFELLAFRQSFQPGTFNGTDVHEDIFAAGFLLDEAEALCRVEKLDHALAGANHLRWHPTEATCTASTAAGATRATRSAAATRSATAEAITTTAAAKAATIISGTIIAEIAGRLEAVRASAKRIKAFFTEPVAFISAAAAPPIVTHKSNHTLSHRPVIRAPIMGTVGHLQRKTTSHVNRQCLRFRV
jgi:hypothetical protein